MFFVRQFVYKQIQKPYAHIWQQYRNTHTNIDIMHASEIVSQDLIGIRNKTNAKI